MSFDGLSLTALAVELRPQLIGSRVQKIIQPDPLAIALELYGNHQRSWLLLSAEPQRPRVYLTAAKPGRGVETPSPMLLLLRKHIDGARLADIVQPPGERILSFGFVTYSLGGDEATPSLAEESRPTFRLIIEAISQYSNLILVGADGLVLDALRRVSSGQNRFRVTLPHQPYSPPPPQKKRGVDGIDAASCLAALEAAAPGAAIWQALVTGFAGLGPLAGREATFRALGDAKAKVPLDVSARGELAVRLAEALEGITRPVLDGSFVASVAVPNGEGSAVPTGSAESPRGSTAGIAAFAPYPLTHLGRWEPRNSLSQAADEFYRQVESVAALDLVRRSIHTAIAAERSLAERKRDSLQRALATTVEADDLRQRGELLLTYSAVIPRGAATFSADGVSVQLDPRWTAVENAQACFRRYRKAKAALREVPTLLAEAKLRLRYLDEIAAMVNIAETTEQVRALRAEIRPQRELPGRPTKKRPPRRTGDGVLRLRASDGSELLVGRSALQNNTVTFDLARPEDVWLHARGCPGAHVILRTAGGEPSERSIREAAAIAAYFSSNREAARVQVDWTRRKLVRRLGKGTPGLVSYTGEQTINVRPEQRVAAEEPLSP